MKKLLALVAAFLFAVGGAQAALVSFSDVYGPQGTDWQSPGRQLSLQKFDPLLGTLNAITFHWLGTLDSTFRANAGEDPTSVNYTAAGEMTFSFPMFNSQQIVFGPQDGSMSLDPFQSKNESISLQGGGTHGLLADIDFIGSGVFDIWVTSHSTSAMTEDSGVGSTRVRTTATAYAQVIYDFTPNRNAVPEPGSLALLGLALAAAGLASRRRT